ncbi:MAG TPA: hypothetical protein VLT45_10130 [Kofleriaceae bacterium]|nr:hypothetical protein [Kofleriaceae bacterium]
MGRTALYRDPVPWRPARAEVALEHDELLIEMPGKRMVRHRLHGVDASTADGVVAAKHEARVQRRFVRMLILQGNDVGVVLITPPDQGAVAPNVVRVPEAPAEAPILDVRAWEALADFLLSGGRLGACSIVDLARLSCIATPQFAVLIGEVAAQRALEMAWGSTGPLRGSGDVETQLTPLVLAARHSPRAGEALVSALAFIAGATRRRRR